MFFASGKSANSQSRGPRHFQVWLYRYCANLKACRLKFVLDFFVFSVNVTVPSRRAVRGAGIISRDYCSVIQRIISSSTA